MISLLVAACRRFAFAASLAALCATPATAAPARQTAPSGVPVVHTTYGAVRGTAVQNMNAYLGIPYAAPPVGPLRWQPPQPHATWSGIHAATKFGNHCPQGPSPFGIGSTTESCLFLNVFVPAGTPPGAKLPVLVWIHGGAFTSGESDDYDPDRLVAQGTIVVTLNYRLGYLGFLATTGLDAEPHVHVNYGLLDQQFAIAWAKANAAAFGGDPSRVTIFGQSAGGESVFAQLLSPGSAGLFSRALIESGAYEILALPSLATAQTAGNALAQQAGCQPSQTRCLRKLSVPQVLALQASSSVLGGGPSPAVDGVMIPLAPAVALAAGAFSHVPLIQGGNHDEFRLFTAELFDLSGGPLTAAEYPAAVTQALTDIGLQADASAVLQAYPLSNYPSPDLAFSAFATDAVFCFGAYATDTLLAAQLSQLYAYEFADENAPEDFLPPVSFPYGAAHGSELQFLWDSFTRSPIPLTPAEQQLAATMVSAWTQFGATGSPNGASLPSWSTYSATADDMLSLVPPTPNMFTKFATEHNSLFWLYLFSQGGGLERWSPQHVMTLDTLRHVAHVLRPLGRRR